MNRRVFLKSTFATLALPALESIAGPTRLKAAAKSGKAPMRMICVGNSFGMHPESFFPKETGSHYGMTHLLEPMAGLRKDFSIFSHLDHGVKGGHFAVHSFLSGVKVADAKGMPEGNISVDQRASEFVGAETRFPSLTVGSDEGLHGGCRMCWTRSGVRVPPIEGPRELFRKLFINDDVEAQERAAENFELKRSILDSVTDQSERLERRLSSRDKEKLDEYFTSIRDVEVQLALDKRWQSVSKPKPTMPEPDDRSMVEDIPVLYDLILAAIETDSTRIATFEMAGQDFDTSFFGLRGGYHAFSHHGKKPEKIEGLLTIEHYQMKQLARFIEKLKSIQEADTDGTLLDNTMVLFGSGMGNGNAHVNKDLPIILAGGGFKLGEHRKFPSEQSKRVPLSNLYVSMLQRFGVETDSFSKSTGTLTGLELA